MQRRVVDFVRVGYFIPLNGPLNGHPPSFHYDRRYIYTLFEFSVYTTVDNNNEIL